MHRLPDFRAPGVLLGVLLCLLAPLAPADPCQPSSSLEPVEVSRVIDGDTLRLSDERRVRLIGVDAPELDHEGGDHEPLARKATERVKALLPGNRRIYLQPGEQPRDQYGRLLADAFLSKQGDSLEARLLEEGLAWQVVVPPNVRMARCHHAAEQRARRADRGVWAIRQYAPRAAETLAAGETGFRRIRGRVTAVAETRELWWIELEDSLSLRLSKRDLRRYFSDADPQGWQGRELTVRGWAIHRGTDQRGHPPHMMHLRHPLMLESVDY